MRREQEGRTTAIVLLGIVLVSSIGVTRIARSQAGQENAGGPTSALAVRVSRDSSALSRAAPVRDSGTAIVTSEPDTGPGVRARRTEDAVTEAAREYERTGVARTVEEGAFVTFPYGHGQPTLTCAPLRACVIELESGEAVLSRIAGDTQRWEIELAPAGPDGRTPLVVVKPHDCGLTTNLVLTTTAGRIYDLTLDSPPCARGGVNPHGIYVRHVRFYYPDATVQAWSAVAPAPAPMPDHVASGSHADAFNFAYRVRRLHRFPWIPLAVFDDGIHCYIKLPPHAAHREAPVLFALSDAGGKVLLNYSLSHETYVTDRVFRSAVLVIGDADSEEELRIDNLQFDAPADAAAAASSSVGGPAAVRGPRQ
jgi:type IV secretion system protein VirB9